MRKAWRHPPRREGQVDFNRRRARGGDGRDRRLLQHALSCRGEGRSHHAPEYRATRPRNLDRAEGDGTGEGVGDEQVVFEMVAAIVAADHMRRVQRRYEQRGGGDGEALGGTGCRPSRHGHEAEQGEQRQQRSWAPRLAGRARHL